MSVVFISRKNKEKKNKMYLNKMYLKDIWEISKKYVYLFESIENYKYGACVDQLENYTKYCYKNSYTNLVKNHSFMTKQLIIGSRHIE